MVRSQNSSESPDSLTFCCLPWERIPSLPDAKHFFNTLLLNTGGTIAIHRIPSPPEALQPHDDIPAAGVRLHRRARRTAGE